MPAKVEIQNKFVTKDLIDLDVRIDDKDNAILNNKVRMELRDEKNTLVETSEVKMNKTDLIKMVAEKANKPTKEVAEIIDSFFKELSQNLREKDVSIKDFGTFKKIIQPARIARNPATGEPVEVPEKEVVKFKPSKNILNMKWL